VEQLLESLFAASRISSGVDVRVRDLPLQRAVRTAVHAAGAAPYVDVAIPSLLRVSADETLLVQVLRELLAEAAVSTQPRSAITAAPVADAVAVQVDVPDPGPLRRHVASRLVEAMRGRAEVDAMGTMSILLPPAGTDGWMPR
jgi:K+-sensing histidine kinase KdpD